MTPQNKNDQPAHEEEKFSALLDELLTFIREEREAANQKLVEIWKRPLAEKLENGWSQGFVRLERGEPHTLWAYLDDSESRFREGDLLLLHNGNALEALGRRLSLELEEDDRWLLRGDPGATVLDGYEGGPCYADPDAMDLTAYYEQALDEIATSQIGREVVLPLLSGELEITFDDRDRADAERIAQAEHYNAKQAEAVGLAYAAEQMA
jgi:DNA replication ATP-dependent helicase Dna2